jgi:putative Mg2+ transporter-C (MgtC) family protein
MKYRKTRSDNEDDGNVQEIWNTVLSEFSDVPDAEQVTVSHCVFVAATRSLLGYEREQQGKSAGVRTHMMVAIGGTVRPHSPTSRGIKRRSESDIAGLIAGVGFLGTGAIIMGNK